MSARIRRPAPWWIALGLCLVGALALWLSARALQVGASPSQPSRAVAAAGRGTAEGSAIRPTAFVEVRDLAPRATAPESRESPPPALAADGLPFIGPAPEDVPVGFAHPHPITAAHVRLRAERLLVARLGEAMQRRSGGALREALLEYEQQFPDDMQRLQEGYGIIADCLEQADETARLAAQHFYAQHRGSSLRRWVRRLCLEP